MTPAAPHHHPAWFGAVMGTGALALAFAAQASTWSWDWLSKVAAATLILATLFGIVLLPRYARRLGNRTALREEIANPAHGAMLATLPAGLLVLAVGWGRIGPSMIPTTAALWIDAVLLSIGTLIAVALGLTWSATMLRSAPGLEGVNGGWMIPPVMNMLVPLGLAPLIVANPEAAPLLILIGFAFYGIGTLLFIAILTLLIARLALNDPLPAPMAPSMWIPLAPAGVVGLSLMRLLQSGSEAQVPGFDGATAGIVVAVMGIGFGLWWAAFAGLELHRIRKAGGAPVHPGWWGFVFPVAAMTLSIAAVGAATGILAVEVMGLLATIALTVLWLLVLTKTFRLLRPTSLSNTRVLVEHERSFDEQRHVGRAVCVQRLGVVGHAERVDRAVDVRPRDRSGPRSGCR
jgi:C4-dicarboxylate transporter/malic acid transport protein